MKMEVGQVETKGPSAEMVGGNVESPTWVDFDVESPTWVDFGRGSSWARCRASGSGESRNSRASGCTVLDTGFGLPKRGSSTSSVDLGEITEVFVSRAEDEVVLNDERGDPEIVGWDWRPLAAKLPKERSVHACRPLCGIK